MIHFYQTTWHHISRDPTLITISIFSESGTGTILTRRLVLQFLFSAKNDRKKLKFVAEINKYFWLSCPQNRQDQLYGPHILLFNGYQGPFPGVKRPGRVVDHSHPSSAEVMNGWSYKSTPPNAFMVETGTNLFWFWLFLCFQLFRRFPTPWEEQPVFLDSKRPVGSVEATSPFWKFRHNL